MRWKIHATRQFRGSVQQICCSEITRTPSFLIRLIFWRGYRLGVSFANGSTSEVASHIVGRTWRRWTKAGANVLSPSKAASKACLGPDSSNRGLVAPQRPEPKGGMRSAAPSLPLGVGGRPRGLNHFWLNLVFVIQANRAFDARCGEILTCDASADMNRYRSCPMA